MKLNPNVFALSMSHHQRRNTPWLSLIALVAAVVAVTIFVYMAVIGGRVPVGTVVGGTDVVTPTPQGVK